MFSARSLFAATLVGACLGAVAYAQAPAPKFTPILSGKDFTAPVRGKVDVEFAKPPVRRQKDMVIDEFTVKNLSDGPIARLTIESIYYDKGGAVVAGGRKAINGLLKPGEVQTVIVETPFTAGMSSSNYKFTHANGTVEPKKVDKIVDPEAEAKAAEKKAAAAKK
jgi:hypothetical protein